MDENEFSLIEKYACAAYDPENSFRTSDINRLWFVLFTKSSENKLKKLFPTKEALVAPYFMSTLHFWYDIGDKTCGFSLHIPEYCL